MSTTIKTQANDSDVTAFINTVDNETRRKDALTLLEIFSNITKQPPKMWGTSIIGFGSYHYKSERSRQEADWMLTGFSPRKQSMTLYLTMGFDGYQPLLDKLGKHKTGKGCLYINSLADVDMSVLETLISETYETMKVANEK